MLNEILKTLCLSLLLAALLFLLAVVVVNSFECCPEDGAGVLIREEPVELVAVNFNPTSLEDLLLGVSE